MPDLGSYSVYVLSAYGVSLTLLALIIVASLRASSKVRRELDVIEARREAKRNG